MSFFSVDAGGAVCLFKEQRVAPEVPAEGAVRPRSHSRSPAHRCSLAAVGAAPEAVIFSLNHSGVERGRLSRRAAPLSDIQNADAPSVIYGPRVPPARGSGDSAPASWGWVRAAPNCPWAKQEEPGT